MNASEMAAIASLAAIEDSGIDKEKIDQIIVAHNYGDLMPDLFSRIPCLPLRRGSSINWELKSTMYRLRCTFRLSGMVTGPDTG